MGQIQTNLGYVQMSRADYLKYVQDSKDKQSLLIKYKFLEEENNKLKDKLDSITLHNSFEIQELEKWIARLERDLDKEKDKTTNLFKQLEYKEKVIASKNVAIDKWKHAYYLNIKYKKQFVFNTTRKWFEITLTSALLGGAIYAGMEIADNL